MGVVPSDREGLRPRRTDRIAVALALLSVLLAGSLHAESEDERRVKAGARLFRAILSADLDIENKAEAGALTIVVVGSDRDSFAELAASIITPPEQESAATVKGIPLRSVIASVEDLMSNPPARCGGVFLAGRLRPADLRAIISFASGQKVIAFSPFEGDVEQGVLGGLSIEARVKPYVNEQALAESGVHLKEKFLKVSKLY